MDDRIGNHSANMLRTHTQKIEANICVDGIEHNLLLLSCVFLFLHSATKNKENRVKSLQLKTNSNRLEGQIYSYRPFIVIRSDHNKMEKRLEKMISVRQHHPYIDVAV